MRRLALLPLLVFAVSCDDATVLQPDEDLPLAVAVTAPQEPNDPKIAFKSHRVEGGSGEIFVINVDRTALENLTKHPGYDANPAWSPDGSKIAFQSLRGEAASWDIYVMNWDGTGLVRLTSHPDADSYPDWSPDGSKIAFNSTRDGNFEIYVMNADGTGQVNLTNDPTADLYPAWSPDGSRIAFTSRRQGRPGDVYLMNADGTGVQRIMESGAQPAWSPDGSKIAFVRDGDIYVMNADGTVAMRLTTDGAGHPDWSPDGSQIAFHSRRDDPWWEIYVMNADGTGVERLTYDPAIDVSPDWGLLELVRPVSIDIRPGGDPNSINCNNPMAMIPVAILTTNEFDASTVDHATVTFEGAVEAHSTPHGVQRHEKDVDDDGDTDLLFHFRLGETTLDCGSTEATLTGETFDGAPIEGTDTVNMIDAGQPM